MGRTVTHAVAGLGIGRASDYRWRHGEAEGAFPAHHPRVLRPEEWTVIDQVKEQQPHLRHRRIQGLIQAMGLYLSASSVYKRLKARGWAQSSERRPAPWKEPRDEVVRRHVMWGCDWTQRRIAGLRWYLLTLIDFFSRLVVAHRLVPSVHAGEVKALYQEGLLSQGIELTASGKPELRADRGSPNTSWVTKEFFAILGAELSFARVRRPTDNAITERFYGTIKQEEIYLVGSYPDPRSGWQEIGG